MNLLFKPKFRRDVEKVNNRALLIALQEKLQQIRNASTPSQITGLKLLRSYRSHYRILVKTEKHSYRIGAVIRNDTIWLVRFLSRKTIYLEFP